MPTSSLSRAASPTSSAHVPGRWLSRVPLVSSAGVAVLCLVVGGCRSYPEKTSAALNEFQSGSFEEAYESFSELGEDGSPFLAGAEAGMVALAAGNWSAALESLNAAAQETRELEERAMLSPQSLGEDLLSFVINDTVTSYQGEGYERVMLHASLAIAYLAQGMIDDVWVEARLANRLLEAEQQLYKKEYQAGGLGHFMSAATYELLGQYDEAYIDYRRMVDKGVGLELAGPGLVRIARQLGYRDDLELWIERFGDLAPSDVEDATIVVIAGVGLAPQKQELLIQVPTGSGLVQWAVPRYSSRAQPVDSLVLRTGGAALVRTAVIEDVERIAYENLEDRIAWLATKSALRAALKYKLSERLENNFGQWGALVGAVYTVVSERADLRSWLTLPGTWQAARAFVKPGVQELALDASGGQTVALGSYELEPGETLFILVRTLGTRVYAHVIGGRVILDGSPSEVANFAATQEPTPPLGAGL